MVGIQEHQERIVNNRVPLVVNIVNSIPGKLEPQETNLRIPPVLIGHLLSIGPEPGQVLNLGSPNLTSMEELPAPQDWMRMK